jgi:hypothetical protein
MYGFICALVVGTSTSSYRRNLVTICLDLQQMLTIPQVKEKLPMLQRVCDEGFFDSATALTLEEVRRELRSIVKFLVGMARRKVIYTSLSDPVTTVEYGVTVIPEEDFADYKLKVNRYLADFSDRDPTAYDFPLPLRAVYDYRPTRTPPCTISPLGCDAVYDYRPVRRLPCTFFARFCTRQGGTRAKIVHGIGRGPGRLGNRGIRHKRRLCAASAIRTGTVKDTLKRPVEDTVKDTVKDTCQLVHAFLALTLFSAVGFR